MGWLFHRRRASEPAQPTPPPAPPEPPAPPAGPYLTQTVVFGARAFSRPGEDSSVYIVDEARGIRRQLVDARGSILHFPGIVREAFWTAEVSPAALEPQIHFRTSFEKRGDGWIMLWCIQPDGRYWADDDGFGAEKDQEVTLYTYVDRDGCFTGPFRLYKLGAHGYAMDRFLSHHAASQARALAAIDDGVRCVCWPGDIFPQLRGAQVHHLSDAFYHFRDADEVRDYWSHPVLAEDLRALARALLATDRSLWAILGHEEARVQGSMTLFFLVTGEALFRQVLEKFFQGVPEARTLHALARARGADPEAVWRGAGEPAKDAPGETEL